MGDPDSIEVITRRNEESIVPDVMAARTRNALTLYRPLATVPGVEIRHHDTVLYNSTYRPDDRLMVNTHAYGINGVSPS
ncbi:hypothetical protein ACIBHX_42735 [Nonomuraea sp. NPDC050536]|uniref:hypothetical protein n=1 Tax=Nonomuraea sp. NPDC050536 TaxID=3364366 RepID=UPI0037C74ECD